MVKIFEKFKDELIDKNKNELFNLRHSLSIALMRSEKDRKNPNRNEGNNMLIHDLKKEIAIINSITSDMIRHKLFYYRKDHKPRKGVD